MRDVAPDDQPQKGDRSDRQNWQEILAAALGGYFPQHVPVEQLVDRMKGAK